MINWTDTDNVRPGDRLQTQHGPPVTVLSVSVNGARVDFVTDRGIVTAARHTWIGRLIEERQ